MAKIKTVGRTQLIARLKKLIQSPETKIIIKKINSVEYEAVVFWQGKHISIKVDNYQTGLVTAIIHELLHIEIEEAITYFSLDLQEVIIAALENTLMSDVGKSTIKMDWWKTAIQKKIEPEV